MIQLTPHPDGVCLAVRAQAGAGRNQLRGEHDGALKVVVTQAREKGKANEAIRALLCKQLGLRKSQLTLISGHTSTHKTFLIRECSAESLVQRVDKALETARK